MGEEMEQEVLSVVERGDAQGYFIYPVSMPAHRPEHTLRVLNLEDDRFDSELILDVLRGEWPECELTRVDKEVDFIAALDAGHFDTVVSDFTLPGFDVGIALEIVQERCPDVPFIFCSGTIGEEKAIELMKRGASDYVLKEHM